MISSDCLFGTFSKWRPRSWERTASPRTPLWPLRSLPHRELEFAAGQGEILGGWESARHLRGEMGAGGPFSSRATGSQPCACGAESWSDGDSPGPSESSLRVRGRAGEFQQHRFPGGFSLAHAGRRMSPIQSAVLLESSLRVRGGAGRAGSHRPVLSVIPASAGGSGRSLTGW